MAVATRKLQYEQIPSGLYVATTKALDERGIPVVDITWYGSKEWVQEKGLVLPYSREWSEAREHFKTNHPDIEKDMITGPAEWTDSLIAHPNKNGDYASNLNNTRLPKRGKGKYTLLVEGSVVEKRSDGSYVIDGGEVIELPNFPNQVGYLQKAIPELGLTEESYLLINFDFNYDKGLRPVIRGGKWDIHDRRFGADANWGPLDSSSILGRRPAKRGLVGTGNETDFLRVPREGA